MKIKVLLLGISVLLFTGCKKMIDADPENLKGWEEMFKDPNFAQGFLTTAYRTVPGYYDNSEYATDDAVTNQRNNAILFAATGSWTAINNPFSAWDPAYGSMQYLNLFLANADKVTFAFDPAANKLFAMRMKGEAFGLRALHMYYLLRAHAGFTADGQLMGIPIITEMKTVDSELNLPRASFEVCVKQIYKDLDSAEAYLPLEFNDVSTVPAQFSAITQSSAVYNRVMGNFSKQLLNGLIAKSFRTRTALLAASPAFQHSSNTTTWANAAEYAGAIIAYKGGVNSLPANGFTYYTNKSEIDGLGSGNNPSEMIWRENVLTNESSQETAHFPPTFFGSGNMNPTQNLVDAFPMANGFPITDSRSLYNSANPYAGRDPRLGTYIIFNGSTVGEGANAKVIRTGSQSGSDDGINRRENSTRTGYYMKKRLRMDVSRTPSSITNKNHIIPRIRYTEMYLAYAEAANEAWGPTGVGTRAFSAYDVIKRIRSRAGVGTGTGGDVYLEECKTDKNKMRELIRNERRLELSFESFRFWDLRRWKANLNETARGMDVNGTVFTPVLNVEPRSFADYMYYGPIPLTEILKFSNLTQNKGWK